MEGSPGEETDTASNDEGRARNLESCRAERPNRLKSVDI
jgi:hypothetical protein